MVVQLIQPCRVRYRRRGRKADRAPATTVKSESKARVEEGRPPCARLEVDYDLCQGHTVCLNEAPEIFGFDDDQRKVVLLDQSVPEDLIRKVELAVEHCPTRALTLKKY